MIELKTFSFLSLWKIELYRLFFTYKKLERNVLASLSSLGSTSSGHEKAIDLFIDDRTHRLYFNDRHILSDRTSRYPVDTRLKRMCEHLIIGKNFVDKNVWETPIERLYHAVVTCCDDYLQVSVNIVISVKECNWSHILKDSEL